MLKDFEIIQSRGKGMNAKGRLKTGEERTGLPDYQMNKRKEVEWSEVPERFSQMKGMEEPFTQEGTWGLCWFQGWSQIFESIKVGGLGLGGNVYSKLKSRAQE